MLTVTFRDRLIIRCLCVIHNGWLPEVELYTVFQKTRAPFLFLRLLRVLLADLNNIRRCCSKLKFATKHAFQILYWCVVFNCNPSPPEAGDTPSTATVGINITQQNPTLKLVTQFEMNAKHSKRRSYQVFKKSSANFHRGSSVKNMTSTADAGKRHSSFNVRVRCNAQFATSSSCARRSFRFWQTIRYTKEWWIPIFREILHVVMWLLGDLPDSQSIYWQNQRCHYVHTVRSSASLMPSRTASVSQFS